MKDGSKDGRESGDDQPNVRVTRLQLDEKETAAGVFERGGEADVEGIICRTSWTGDVVCCLSVYVSGKERVKYSFAQSNIGRVYILKR